MQLCSGLRLGASEVVSIVGGGGKTTLMFRLADEIAASGGKVVTTTTTRIFAAQTSIAPVHLVADYKDKFLAELKEKLERCPHVLVTGPVKRDSDKAYGVSSELVNDIVMDSVDSGLTVIVEADGSRMRSLKAPADHEPVIPKCTTTVVPVVGADIFNKLLNDKNVHRSKLASDMLDLCSESRITPEVVARLLLHKRGGMKQVPDHARWIPFINKVSSRSMLSYAADTAQLLLKGGIKEVIVGALLDECPIVKRFSKVASIILAAGGSTRMGQDMEIKQMLPWGKGTLTTRVAEAAIQSKSDVVKVVVGNQADRVSKVLAGMNVEVVCNKNWSHGQSASVKAGLNSLDDDISAALFLLVDQPAVGPELINAIVNRFHETGASIVAPRVAGKHANPVLFDRDLWKELFLIKGDNGGRELIKRYYDKIAWVDWKDDIRNEINTKEDYQLMADV